MKKIILLIFLSFYSFSYSKDYSWKLIDSIDNFVVIYYTSMSISNDVYILAGSRNLGYPMTRYSLDKGKNWEYGFIDSSFMLTLSNEKNVVRNIFLDKNLRSLALADSGYYYYTDNLKDWTKKQFSGNTYPAHVCSNNYKDKILYSMGDVIYQTTDYGKTWTDIFKEHQDSANPKNITQIEMLSENDIYIVYYQDKDHMPEFYQLAKTTDGGKTWVDLFKFPHYIDHLKFTSKKIAFAFRSYDNGINRILKTFDGGKSWELIYTYDYKNNKYMSIIAFANDSVGIFVDENRDYYRTYNGGTTWLKDNSIVDINRSIRVGTFKFLDDKTILMGARSRFIFMFTDRDDFPINVGIEDYPELLNDPNPLIFPNPSSEKISLDLGGVELVDLVFYDILGNEILSILNYTNKSEIDISTLSIGTYTIQIQTSTGSISQRLLVNR